MRTGGVVASTVIRYVSSAALVELGSEIRAHASGQSRSSARAGIPRQRRTRQGSRRLGTVVAKAAKQVCVCASNLRSRMLRRRRCATSATEGAPMRDPNRVAAWSTGVKRVTRRCRRTTRTSRKCSNTRSEPRTRCGRLRGAGQDAGGVEALRRVQRCRSSGARDRGSREEQRRFWVAWRRSTLGPPSVEDRAARQRTRRSRRPWRPSR